MTRLPTRRPLFHPLPPASAPGGKGILRIDLSVFALLIENIVYGIAPPVLKSNNLGHTQAGIISPRLALFALIASVTHSAPAPLAGARPGRCHCAAS